MRVRGRRSNRDETTPFVFDIFGLAIANRRNDHFRPTHFVVSRQRISLTCSVRYAWILSVTFKETWTSDLRLFCRYPCAHLEFCLLLLLLLFCVIREWIWFLFFLPHRFGLLGWTCRWRLPWSRKPSSSANLRACIPLSAKCIGATLAATPPYSTRRRRSAAPI